MPIAPHLGEISDQQDSLSDGVAKDFIELQPRSATTCNSTQSTSPPDGYSQDLSQNWNQIMSSGSNGNYQNDFFNFGGMLEGNAGGPWMEPGNNTTVPFGTDTQSGPGNGIREMSTGPPSHAPNVAQVPEPNTDIPLTEKCPTLNKILTAPGENGLLPQTHGAPNTVPYSRQYEPITKAKNESYEHSVQSPNMTFNNAQSSAGISNSQIPSVNINPNGMMPSGQGASLNYQRSGAMPWKASLHGRGMTNCPWVHNGNASMQQGSLKQGTFPHHQAEKHQNEPNQTSRADSSMPPNQPQLNLDGNDHTSIMDGIEKMSDAFMNSMTNGPSPYASILNPQSVQMNNPYTTESERNPIDNNTIEAGKVSSEHTVPSELLALLDDSMHGMEFNHKEATMASGPTHITNGVEDNSLKQGLFGKLLFFYTLVM